MTRINTVDPSDLMDQHLIAEYREIFMIGPSLVRTLKSKIGYDPNRVLNYTLGKGHVYFFYNKGKYLEKRYMALCEEMKKRGFNPDPTRKFNSEFFPSPYDNDWVPTQHDIDVNLERINYRISQRPNWYRKTTYAET